MRIRPFSLVAGWIIGALAVSVWGCGTGEKSIAPGPTEESCQTQGPQWTLDPESAACRCTPQCESRCGGDDGCGDTCPAECGEGLSCNPESSRCETPMLCFEGEKRCEGNVSVRCTRGAWVAAEDCAASSMICTAGECKATKRLGVNEECVCEAPGQCSKPCPSADLTCFTLSGTKGFCTFACTRSEECAADFPKGCCTGVGTGADRKKLCYPQRTSDCLCMESERRCNRDKVERCNADAGWDLFDDCAPTQTTCLFGTCLSSETKGALCAQGQECKKYKTAYYCLEGGKVPPAAEKQCHLKKTDKCPLNFECVFTNTPRTESACVEHCGVCKDGTTCQQIREKDFDTMLGCLGEGGFIPEKTKPCDLLTGTLCSGNFTCVLAGMKSYCVENCSKPR